MAQPFWFRREMERRGNGEPGGDRSVAFQGSRGRQANGGAEQRRNWRRKAAAWLGQRKGTTPKVGWARVGHVGQVVLAGLAQNRKKKGKGP
jgi:hypothetical protein